jgi:hypothetical protein
MNVLWRLLLWLQGVWAVVRGSEGFHGAGVS